MTRYLSALRRNFDELQRAKMARVCARGFEVNWPPTHLHAKLYYNALSNDYLTKCMKVFERRSQTASFWYLERTNAATMLSALDGDASRLLELRAVSERLKHIRDKVHLHIDETGVLDPDRVWADAGLSSDRLDNAVDIALSALARLVNQHRIQAERIPTDMNLYHSTRVATYLNAMSSRE